MFATVQRIFAMLLSALLGLLSSLGILPQSSDYYVETTVEYHNEEAGNADALITLSANKDGVYTFWWGNEQGKKLQKTVNDKTFPYSHFAEVEVLLGEGQLDLPDFTAIPYGAKYILVCRDDITVDRFAIEEHKRTPVEELTYSFGVISDLHFNRYDMEGGGDVAETTFGRSLQFFDGFDVFIVAMPGDISTDGEAEAFQAFNQIASEFDFPVYTCTGNHDLHAKYKLENWQAYMNAGVYGEEKKEGVLNVSDNGLDFVYSGPDTAGDVYIFLSQTSNNYGMLFNALLTDAQLDWLEEQLVTYSGNRVYLFFHTFLNAPNGNPLMGAGNLVNDLGWSYPLFYTPGATDEVRFRNLLREYDNVVFFSGHSHWAYHMQSLNEHLNVADYDEGGATYVHVSSVSSPRTTDGFQILWSGNDPGMSEGYLVEVYEDYILLYGCDFVNGELLAYAVYQINV
ncbi:MAG: metallophosphoesterase [Clostridia bacterium]|nr:metallophosphoesterase [Clostridia bacterium]